MCVFLKAFLDETRKSMGPVRTVTKQVNMAEFPELGKHCDVQICKQLGESQLCVFVFFFHWLNVQGLNYGILLIIYQTSTCSSCV